MHHSAVWLGLLLLESGGGEGGTGLASYWHRQRRMVGGWEMAMRVVGNCRQKAQGVQVGAEAAQSERTVLGPPGRGLGAWTSGSQGWGCWLLRIQGLCFSYSAWH